MITCVIIDDEVDAIFMLRKILEKNFFDEVKVMAVAENIKEGEVIIEKYQPQLVFLDIRMRDGTGFDLLSKIREKNFKLIFVTAYDQYAIKAFQFNPLAYLMKPIKLRDLKIIIDKAKLQISLESQKLPNRTKVLVESYDDIQIKKIVVSNINGFRVLPINDILRLEGDRNYTNFILTGDKKITSSKTLGEYEKVLKEFGFYRIHQSSIINLKHVVGYFKGDGGFVEMTDGKQVAVSRNRKSEFMKRFL